MKLSAPSRRQIVIAGALAAVGAAAVLEGPKLLKKRYAPSPYDDLLALLDDRDADAQLGEAVLAGRVDFDPDATAAALRARIAKRGLSAVVEEDAEQGRIVEANGWVLPQTLALLCALAAKANG
jgi:hypothetical protein